MVTSVTGMTRSTPSRATKSAEEAARRRRGRDRATDRSRAARNSGTTRPGRRLLLADDDGDAAAAERAGDGEGGRWLPSVTRAFMRGARPLPPRSRHRRGSPRAPRSKGGCRSAAGGGRTRRRAAPAGGRAPARTRCGPTVSPAASTLMGTQSIRLLQPGARSRATNAPRVAIGGIEQVHDGRRLVEVRRAPGDRLGAPVDVADRDRQARTSQAEVPAAEQAPAHQARQPGSRQSTSAPGRMMRVAMPSAARLALASSSCRHLPQVYAPSGRESLGPRRALVLALPRRCAAAAAPKGCSRAPAARHPRRASRGAGAAWRRSCCADARR